MRLLIDTHVLIWYLDNFERIPERIKQMILSTQNQRFISIVSIWEIAVKKNKNKLDINCSLTDLVRILEAKDFILLPIKVNHLETYIKLPYIHKCPFDRLLTSIAITEKFKFITCDVNIHKYPVDWDW